MQRSPALTRWPLCLYSSSTQQEPLVASVTSRQPLCHCEWLLLWEQDLHGSDLENMSLSKRFLKEGEKGEISRDGGDR